MRTQAQLRHGNRGYHRGIPASEKLSLHLSPAIADELEREAVRLDRSRSWLMQQAWRIALPELRTMPAHDDVLARAGACR